MAEKEIKSCSKGCEEMTDNEVIKALEVCAYSDDCLKECPFFNYKADCTKRLTASALEIIKRHQSNVSPVKHGHWESYDTTFYVGTDELGEPKQRNGKIFYCHNSDCRYRTIIKTNYCPNCGAKMDGGEGE